MADIIESKIVNGKSIPTRYSDKADGTFAEVISATLTGGGGDASAANQVTTNTQIGGLTETAPASDTASSGLNGRLQRIAQRLTSLIALLPSSLGAKTGANSLSIVPASDATFAISGGGDASAANQTTLNTEVGGLTETAPASDTASSGLNGRLQRIAQRLTSLIALVPGSLGQKTSANSFAVTVASDQSTLATSVADGSNVTIGAIADAAYTSGSGSVVAVLKGIFTKLAAIATGTPTALGQTTMSASSPVTIASNQSALSVTDTRLPSALGQATMANSVAVALASNQSALSVTDTLLPVALGQGTMAQSLRVVLPSDQSSLPVTPAATEAHLGQVGGTTAIISPAITTSASPAYSANDVVGGVITLSNAVRVSGGTGVLQSILVKDTTNQKAALTILLFNANPGTGTYTDNGALTLNATDEILNIRKINVLASDYETVNGTAIADLLINKPIKATSGTSLFAVIITTGTPTYGANATSLYVNFGILQD